MNPHIDRFGNRQWFNEKTKLHRIDGPAEIYESGYKAWWINGKRHRDDGPAVVYSDGTEIWWINGMPIKPIPNIICILRRKLKQ